MIRIENPQPLIAADPLVAGAVVKILVAGGTRLDANQMQRASGLSAYLWQRKASRIAQIIDQVKAA